VVMVRVSLGREMIKQAPLEQQQQQKRQALKQALLEKRRQQGLRPPTQKASSLVWGKTKQALPEEHQPQQVSKQAVGEANSLGLGVSRLEVLQQEAWRGSKSGQGQAKHQKLEQWGRQLARQRGCKLVSWEPLTQQVGKRVSWEPLVQQVGLGLMLALGALAVGVELKVVAQVG